MTERQTDVNWMGVSHVMGPSKFSKDGRQMVIRADRYFKYQLLIGYQNR